MPKRSGVKKTKDELSRLLSRMTVQDLLLGLLSVAPNLRLSSSRSRMMNVLYRYTKNLREVPKRFRKLFRDLSEDSRTEGSFERGGSWSYRVENAMGFLSICDGVGMLFPGQGAFYVIDTPARAQSYLDKYFSGLTDEEYNFLVRLANEVNGEV